MFFPLEKYSWKRKKNNKHEKNLSKSCNLIGSDWLRIFSLSENILWAKKLYWDDTKGEPYYNIKEIKSFIYLKKELLFIGRTQKPHNVLDAKVEDGDPVDDSQEEFDHFQFNEGFPKHFRKVKKGWRRSKICQTWLFCGFYELLFVLKFGKGWQNETKCWNTNHTQWRKCCSL